MRTKKHEKHENLQIDDIDTLMSRYAVVIYRAHEDNYIMHVFTFGRNMIMKTIWSILLFYGHSTNFLVVVFDVLVANLKRFGRIFETFWCVFRTFWSHFRNFLVSFSKLFGVIFERFGRKKATTPP